MKHDTALHCCLLTARCWPAAYCWLPACLTQRLLLMPQLWRTMAPRKRREKNGRMPC